MGEARQRTMLRSRCAWSLRAGLSTHSRGPAASQFRHLVCTHLGFAPAARVDSTSRTPEESCKDATRRSEALRAGQESSYLDTLCISSGCTQVTAAVEQAGEVASGLASEGAVGVPTPLPSRMWQPGDLVRSHQSVINQSSPSSKCRQALGVWTSTRPLRFPTEILSNFWKSPRGWCLPANMSPSPFPTPVHSPCNAGPRDMLERAGPRRPAG